MDQKKWTKYLRIPEEHPASSEQVDNMKHWGRHMLKHDCVLDVGAGTGMLVDWLGKRGVHAAGVTINKKEIDLGKRRYGKDLRLSYGDMHELPYSDGKLDAIHCKDTYEHAIAPYIALCEFNRVLKPGGFCLIVMPDEKWIECEYHYSVLYERQMREMFKKCKFDLKNITVGLPPVGGTIFTSYFAYKISGIEFS